MFDSYKFTRPLDLSDICRDLSKMRLLAGFEVDTRFYEIGSFKGIEDFTRYLKGPKNEL